MSSPRTWTAPGLSPDERDALRQILDGEYSQVPWREQANANASRDRPKPPPKKPKAQPLFRSKR